MWDRRKCNAGHDDADLIVWGRTSNGPRAPFILSSVRIARDVADTLRASLEIRLRQGPVSLNTGSREEYADPAGNHEKAHQVVLAGLAKTRD